MKRNRNQKAGGAASDGISRRSVLRGITAAGSLAALAPTVQADATSDRFEKYFDRFSTVIHMGEAGADASGNVPIGDLLRRYADDDTLLMFPPGEYLMTEQFRFTGFTNLGIVGHDATIVPGTIEELDGRIVVEGTFEGPTRLFRLGVSYAPGEKLLFEGFDFDFTAKYSGFRAIEAYASDDMLVRDIDIVGEHDVGSFGPALFSVTESDGICSVEGFRAPDGSKYSDETIGTITDGPTGILIPKSHQGKLWLRDCELGGFADQGVYGSSTDGRVVVDGGVYKNSNSANIRLMSSYSYVKNATIVVDDADPGHNQRGIRLDNGKHLWVYNTDITLTDPNGHAITVHDGVEKARIEESSITVGSKGHSDNGIVISPGAGRVDIFDTDIHFDGTGNPLSIRGYNDPGDARVYVLRTTISGSGSGEDGRNGIRCTRANVDFRDVEVHMDGDNYRRALELQGDNCTVDGGVFEATHHAIVNVADGTDVQNATTRSYVGFPSLKLYDGSSIAVADSTVYDGYVDRGADDVDFDNVTFPDS